MSEKQVQPWFHPHAHAPVTHVLIIGAGLAGSWLAYELSQLDVSVTVLDAGDGAATGASGNPAGVVKPFITKAPSPPGDFYREAFLHLLQRLQQIDPAGMTLAEACRFDQCGVLQLTETRYSAHADWQVLTPEQANRMAGTTVNSHAIAFPLGGWLNPAALCQALLDRAVPALHFNAYVHSLEQDDELQAWTTHCTDGRQFTSSHVVLANGNGISAFPMTSQIPIVPARGQLSRFRVVNDAADCADGIDGIDGVDGGDGVDDASCANPLQCVVSGKHYAMPDGDSIVTGATFQRDDSSPALREQDTLKNHSGCLELLPKIDLESTSLSSHAGIRATTPDRFPVAGPLPDLAECRRIYASIRFGGALHRLPRMPTISGLSIIGGFGSRGIVSAPWTACSLARQLVGQPLMLTDNQEPHFRRMLANRFLIRDLMRWEKEKIPV